MSGHSNIGPSSAERWINCPGSVALSAKCPKPPTNKYAARGTVEHDLAERLVTGKLDDLALMAMIGQVVSCDGHEIEIEDDMIEGVTSYRDLIDQDHKELLAMGKPANVHALAETRIHLKSISPDLWGTADYILFQKGNKLTVYDYKGGKSIIEAEENKQMGLYALGAMETVAGGAFNEVELVIVQPHAGHVDGQVRRWVAPREWLLRFREEAHAAVVETQSPNAKLVAGDHCKWCPAKSAGCPAIYNAAMAQTQVEFSAVPPSESEVKAGALRGLPTVALMPIEKLALALDWQEAIESWFSSIKDRAREMLEAGQEVPGYKLVDGRANRKYIEGVEEILVSRHGSVHGDRLFAPRKLLGITAMEKLIGKDKLGDLTMKPEPKKAVAKISDPRRVAAQSAQQDFDPFGAAGALPAPAPAPAPNPMMEPFDPFGPGALEKHWNAPIVDPFGDDTLAVTFKKVEISLEDELLGIGHGAPSKRIWP